MTHLVQVNPLLFEPGDRLSLAEFLHRWEQMPGLKFAELIDGVVYMPSPLSFPHGQYDMYIHAWLVAYMVHTGVCNGAANATWLMVGNAPQPDAALRLLPEFGGKTTIGDDNLANGSPELVVEVCRSSRSYDLGPKLALYQRAGVQEYVAVVVEEERVQWRVLESGSYRLLEADSAGVFKSKVFPGLTLDQDALWKGDSARMLSVLQEGLNSDECRRFLERVRSGG